ncbi:MAG: bifunctional (p)ppGpp synthetase/guanosine-3',5'-bis(diphosphate) 3'-pyrophosphohydrolase [Erysipelotrichaceae bacterium]|nr:bifunctional (p)ppGpp synthetase/guanosine-3',5'-bis(diphosphate) 3'-pyrophosphohydrolase [Erysipelotrichaceae bacterium]MBQ2505355.1 bifunctional (p)ppGpp synthetase/guanosine-3',5'-bis(diphosphate) 3'-pyrophosphohydrolase [Erysipelotrichaceae bacterium]MBQ4019793.1 bifunctional (p)ppGpp synthetase/guanosine-3',5'-bis(diphosphate) 3'-pyrophosphohydrolase [Erysipelotrichaceae bacterium]MBQ5555749.1 bifunctional (p)ppGpp synthetase/guanosine-3',5'-bis(diphosphate) 3'-pyrophosphohydrolase [Erys
MKDQTRTKEDLYEQINTYIKNEESIALIDKAYNYAYEKHKDQKRRSGEPYFVHCLNVAYELAKLKTDPYTISAGLLHDVIEDCNVSKEEFIEEFGEEIYEMVEAVTKISNLKFTDEKEYQAVNHRKILIAMAKDVRVILVKLVDRLHNMRTLQYLPPEKQKRIARETLDVYAPIAHRLGIAEIKNELEDLSFYYLDNEKYHEIAKLVESKKSERDQQIDLMIEDISIVLKMHNIPFRIFGRSKHLYSINKKMVTKNKRFDEILDLLAIRIVTETETNCYEILGYIHAVYRPIPGRLKDYIAMPKMNMYQSLHTTIVGPDGRIYEVQIRTEEMDEIAERGIAAHWSYKEGKTRSQKKLIEELNWLKAFEENTDADAKEYMNDITHDIFNANIYCMTPRGRIIDLAAGATPIDFAYRIHTEVGNQTVGALVNGILVPLNTPLKTGDVVELRTNKNSSPSEDWLKIVKTNHARNKIKAYFLKKELEDKEELIKLGETMLKDELKKHNLDIDEFFDAKKLDKVAGSFQQSTANDLLYAIGCKSMTPIAVVEKLTKLGKKELDLNYLEKITKKNSERNNFVSKTGIMVKGVSSMKIAISPCCSPVYGDKIVGFVSKGQGIKVHRADCPNIANERRLIDVEWDPQKPDIRYEASIKIFSKDRSYLLTDLVTVVAQYKANLTAVNSQANAEDLSATTSMSFMVSDLEHLETIMANLRKVDSVISVERAIK